MRFFTKIRWHLLKMNRYRGYLKYALGEIILVVLGILIALQINTWNSNRKERIQEKNILNEIKKSMQSDIKNQLEPNINTLVEDLNNIRIIDQFLHGQISYHDSINSKFKSLMFSKSFKWETTAYKILENQGVNIILNDRLKEMIMRIYNMQYPEAENFLENFSNNLNLFFRPVMRENFAFEYTYDLETNYVPLNTATLQKNQLFRNSIATAYLNFSNNLKAQKELKEEINRTIELIDQELLKFKQ